MDNNKFTKISKKVFLLLIVLMMAASLPFIGAECNTLINGQNTSIRDLLGTWQLERQSGANIDICPNERVTFFNDNHANLVCPGQDTIFRKFSVNNNELIYQQANLYLSKYRIEIVTESGVTKLKMYGVNVNRNLFYVRLYKDSPAINDDRKAENTINSSEK